MQLFHRRPSLRDSVEALRHQLREHRRGEPLPPALIDLSRELQAVARGEALDPENLFDPQLQALLDALPDPAAVVIAHGRLAATNARFDKMLGSSAHGRNIIEAIRSPELAVAVEKGLGGAHLSEEIELPTQKHLWAWVHPLPDGRALLALRDITAHKRQERMRSDFIANASHELRTPVTAIRGAAETLLSGSAELPEPARIFLDMIVRNSDRLARLTSDLLDLSKIESGEYRPQLEPLPAAEQAEAVCELVRVRAQLKKIGLQSEFDPEAVVLADRRALEQVLVNLLDNAVKYTPEGGTVRVTIARDGPAVRFTVADTGPGIEPRHQARLFERFYRADSGRSRDVGGTGLGLAIVKHLVQAQGGEVGVESGKGGSRFWVRLPTGT